ncbi:MAG: hypothetical protein Q7K03_08350 [Dehalococcoidia bacterium]|nr:hypothetical protein [Dehalococcoidia bacterium]
MSVSATFQKLCDIVAASSGISKAPKIFPPVLNASDLPCAIVIPGPAEWNEQANALYRQVRTYIIRVYVKPVALGKGIDEGVQACLGPMNALGRTFLTNLTLDNTVDEVMQPMSDSGVKGDLLYAAVPYHGFEFQIQVKEKST